MKIFALYTHLHRHNEWSKGGICIKFSTTSSKVPIFDCKDIPKGMSPSQFYYVLFILAYLFTHITCRNIPNLFYYVLFILAYLFIHITCKHILNLFYYVPFILAYLFTHITCRNRPSLMTNSDPSTILNISM